MAKIGHYVLGIDIGTTAAKGGLFDCDGGSVAQTSRVYGTSRRRADWVEQDPDDWVRAAEAILVELTGGIDPSHIRAIGLCSQVNTNVFVDHAGISLFPAIVWQDGRAAAEAADLDRRISAEDRIRWWGGPFGIDVSNTLSRMLWVARHDPDAWAATATVLSPKDYCLMKLTGSVAADMFSSFGLVDQSGRYIPDLLAMVAGAAGRLPPLRRPDEVVGGLRLTALPHLTVPVVAGTMDAWASLFGSGALAAGRGIYNSGTSEIIALASEYTTTTPGIVTFPPWDGLFVHAGPTQSGGDSLRWFASLADRSLEEILSRAAAADRGNAEILFLPHLQGERAPLWDPHSRGSFTGMTSGTGLGDLALAVLEGVAYSARLLLEAAEQAAGQRYPRLLLCGGGARSDLWSQIRADVLGAELHRLDVLDTGSLGAAILAGMGAGVFASAREAAARMVRIGKLFKPDPAFARRYAQGFARYKQTYEALKPVYRL